MGSDALSMAECQNEMQKLFKEYGVTPFTPLKGIFIQGPIFVSFFLAISTMVEKMESFKFVGAYWFTDLSTPDSLYIFPVMTVLTFLLTVEIVSESQKRLPTEDKSGAGIRIHDNKEGEESSAVRFEGEVSLGELIWLKLFGETWWPAVVCLLLWLFDLATSSLFRPFKD
ncbi:hypothetical protein ERO13_D09G043600v2 [Gossypium hirsutum]|nr:hypothetical protein ERO13_D09G043600v2 [Gossypium hirsutum]